MIKRSGRSAKISVMSAKSAKCSFSTSTKRRPWEANSCKLALIKEDLPVPLAPVSKILLAGFLRMKFLVLSRIASRWRSIFCRSSKVISDTCLTGCKNPMLPKILSRRRHLKAVEDFHCSAVSGFGKKVSRWLNKFSNFSFICFCVLLCVLMNGNRH